MHRAVVARIGAALVLAALPAIASAASTVEIHNESKWDIHQFFLAPVDTDEWGPDQLGDFVLEAGGGTFQLRGIPCDSYDVMLVDEDGDECVVPEIDICGGDQGWVIESEALLECEGYE